MTLKTLKFDLGIKYRKIVYRVLESILSFSERRKELTESMKSENIKAGTKIIMTHKERQEFLKTSKLGEITGVKKLL